MLLLTDLPGLFARARRLLLGSRLLTLLSWRCSGLPGSRRLLTRSLTLLTRSLTLLTRGLALLARGRTLLTRCLALLTGSLSLLPRSLPLLSRGAVLPWRGRLLPLGSTGLTDAGTGIGTATLDTQAGTGLVRVFTCLLLLANALPNRGALIDFAAAGLAGARLLRATHARLTLPRAGGTICGRPRTRRRAAGAGPGPVQGDQRHREREGKHRAGCLQSCPHNVLLDCLRH